MYEALLCVVYDLKNHVGQGLCEKYFVDFRIFCIGSYIEYKTSKSENVCQIHLVQYLQYFSKGSLKYPNFDVPELVLHRCPKTDCIVEKLELHEP